MQQASTKYYTPEEYLAREESAEFKSEYYQGEIFAMAGGSFNHARIITNLITYLTNSLSKSRCEIVSNDVRLWVDSVGLFTYPDIMVLCDKPQFYDNRTDTITNPLLIIEVLSESTKNYDRGEKFGFYRAISTLREYILIDQTKPHIEQFSLGKDRKWILTEFEGSDSLLIFSSLNCQIKLQDIYHRVEFKI